jgi:hypothetical protein
MNLCRDDVFFFFEAFLWLYEPRAPKGEPKVIPFIPWTHQRQTIKTIEDNCGINDMGLEKSRGEGATWMSVGSIVKRWRFHEMEAFGVVSRTENTADNPKDPDSLGAKIDWTLSMLPRWMTGDKGKEYHRNVSRHTWSREDNGCTITAYPTSGDVGTGGRKTMFFVDEFAKHDRGPDESLLSSIEPVSDSILIVSTYAGADGAYYQAMKEESSMIKLKLRWQDNESRNGHMFHIDLRGECLRSVEDNSKIEGWEYTDKFFDEYLSILRKRGFDITSKHKDWSPWYVSRCLRPRMTPRKIAQEYDIDATGSGHSFFQGALIETLLDRCVDPAFVGDVMIDYERLAFKRMRPNRNGQLKLWQPVTHKAWRPPPSQYVMGVDIGAGLGGSHTSHSVLTICDKKTGRKVAEFASTMTKPTELCEIAIALCKWYADYDGTPAFLIFEGNGTHGGLFRERLMDSDFRHIYFRIPHKSSKKKPTKEPGFWSGRESKRDLLSEYQYALEEGYFENLNALALRECLCYVTQPGGKVEFVAGSKDEDDPTNDGENHGDRVIADALCYHAMKYLGGGVTDTKQAKHARYGDPPPGSFGARQLIRRRKDKQSWLQRTKW